MNLLKIYIIILCLNEKNLMKCNKYKKLKKSEI